VDILTIKITDLLVQPKSVVLVGETNSGKTHWIKNTLIPHLRSLGKQVEYLRDGNELTKQSPDIVICDEAETLFDKKYLQNNKSDYYSPEYLKKVQDWQKNYSKLPAATLFAITRNQPEQIANLVANFKQADWDNRPVIVFEFTKT